MANFRQPRASNGKREELSVRQKKEPCHRLVSLVSFGFAFCLFASAQAVVPPAAADAQTIPSPDTLGRTTPRGTVLAFLKSARKGDYDAAAEYLNTKRRGEAAADLERKRGYEPVSNSESKTWSGAKHKLIHDSAV
jgi:hypothetical protein